MSLSEEITCTCGASGALDGHGWNCSLRTGVSPAEAQRRRERRQQEETDRYFAELSDAERLYEKIKSKLDAAERTHIAELRARRLSGDRDAYYGHDLHHAVGHGQRVEQREAAGALLAKTAEARKGEGVIFAGSLSALIEAAAARGCPADKIRRHLECSLTDRGSLTIEQTVERHGPAPE